MPQIFKIGSYWVYFWTNENNPIEPIHVHISEGRPVPHATKVWITKDGKCSLANNNSKLSLVILNKLMRVIEARSFEIINGKNILEKSTSIAKGFYRNSLNQQFNDTKQFSIFI